VYIICNRVKPCLIVLCCLITLHTTAFSQTSSPTPVNVHQTKELSSEQTTLGTKQKSLEVITKLRLGQINIESCPTYLDEGIRWLYCHWSNSMNLETIFNILGEPLFVKGPHKKTAHFNAKSSFGYYNPKLIQKVKSLILYGLLADHTFIVLTQMTYNKYLRAMLRSYYLAYNWLQISEEWLMNPLAVKYSHKSSAMINMRSLKTRYLQSLSTGMPVDLGEAVRAPTEALDKKYKGHINELSWYHINTALSWWIRRNIDQTDIIFYEILRESIKVYDPEFVKMSSLP
jgi:hypothetical protein